MRFLAVFVLLAIFAISAAGLWWLLPAGPRLTLPVGNQAAFAGFLPDGQTVATKTLPQNRMVFGEVGGPVRLWDVKTGRQRRQFADGLKYFDVLFSPDSKLAATVNWVDGQCEIWDTANGQQRFTVATRRQAGPSFFNSPPPVAFSADARSLAVPSPDWDLQLWDLPSGRLRMTVPSVRCFALRPTARRSPPPSISLPGIKLLRFGTLIRAMSAKRWRGLRPPCRRLRFHPTAYTLPPEHLRYSPGGGGVSFSPKFNDGRLKRGSRKRRSS